MDSDSRQLSVCAVRVAYLMGSHLARINSLHHLHGIARPYLEVAVWTTELMAATPHPQEKSVQTF